MSRIYYKNNFKSDIFNRDTKLAKKQKDLKKYHNRSTSDVLNQKDSNQPRHSSIIKNGNNNGTAFTHSTPIEKAFISNYNPNKYLRCESAFKQKMKNIYDVNDEALKDIPTTKGYLAKDEYERNCPMKKANGNWEGYRRRSVQDTRLSHSAYIEGEGLNPIDKPRGSKIEFLKSNIFCDKEKDEENHKVIVAKIMKGKYNRKKEECTLPYTQPKPRLREQWHSKLDWHKGQTELVLSSYYKTNTYRKAHSAFSRKMNDMKGNGIFNTEVKPEEEGIADNTLNNPPIPSQSKPLCTKTSETKREAKESKNFSTQFNNNNFYDEAYQLRNLKEENKPIQRLTIQHKGNLRLSELKQIVHEKGLQVNDILTYESSIIRDDSNSFVSFKVKGNNSETFDIKMKEIESKLSNEKGIVSIQPKKYICVNRRDLSKNIEREDRKGLFKANNGKNTQFTTKFDSINHDYKKK